MIIVDTNLLIYAVNSAAPQHEVAKTWLDRQLSAGVEVGLPWLAVIAFVRLSTNPRVFSLPLSVDESLTLVGEWFALDHVRAANPGPNHWEILSRLLLRTGSAGNLTNDAHIAAIAIEHSALVCSADTDFLRFEGVQYHNPLLDLGIQEPTLAYIA